MPITLALESAPFTPPQRTWLNEFLVDVLGLERGQGRVESHALPAHSSKLVVDRQNPWETSVLKTYAVTQPGSAKDVRFVAFDLRDSGLRYRVGDALGVFPQNCPELVQAILDALGATGAEAVVAPDGRRITLRAALLGHYVVTAGNDRLLDLLMRAATDRDERQHLVTLLAAEAETALDKPDLLDLLEAFPSARPALPALVETLDPLQPRLYSISSSQVTHPDEVHVTVGVVKYQKPGCRRLRKGVASTFLAERVRPGEQARIFIQPSHGFGLPADGAVPIIMVGPGTGIAPFRAFLQERQSLRATGPSWLFFGDQRQETDFLYRDELDAFQRAGVLTHLDTAFSRDQQAKVYVQQRMAEQAPRIWDWLERGAYFYVCGDAQRMARDVDATLHRIIAEQGGVSEADAKAYVRTLVRAKRYQRDVY